MERELGAGDRMSIGVDGPVVVLGLALYGTKRMRQGVRNAFAAHGV